MDAVDGHSLLPLLQGTAAPDWRTAALVEHHGPDQAATTRTRRPAGAAPRPRTRRCAPTYMYVEYTDGEIEFYDRTATPTS